ncbi:hypothetical protein PR048_015136 [Dryococelus australis]|uniref:Uncharacterized protein n=1 Tax=Dryococelus australis TaxID=614101 RepID=A0ABQ9HG45_9NEOP|nr:hypothetical protein PR048_015136 [Dryococelus australis]
MPTSRDWFTSTPLRKYVTRSIRSRIPLLIIFVNTGLDTSSFFRVLLNRREDWQGREHILRRRVIFDSKVHHLSVLVEDCNDHLVCSLRDHWNANEALWCKGHFKTWRDHRRKFVHCFDRPAILQQQVSFFLIPPTPRCPPSTDSTANSSLSSCWRALSAGVFQLKAGNRGHSMFFNLPPPSTRPSANLEPAVVGPFASKVCRATTVLYASVRCRPPTALGASPTARPDSCRIVSSRILGSPAIPPPPPHNTRTQRNFRPIKVIEACMEQRRSERVGETIDPREDPKTNGIVRHDSHTRRKSGVTLPAIEPGSQMWEASRLTAQPPRSILLFKSTNRPDFITGPHTLGTCPGAQEFWCSTPKQGEMAKKEAASKISLELLPEAASKMVRNRYPSPLCSHSFKRLPPLRILGFGHLQPLPTPRQPSLLFLTTTASSTKQRRHDDSLCDSMLLKETLPHFKYLELTYDFEMGLSICKDMRGDVSRLLRGKCVSGQGGCIVRVLGPKAACAETADRELVLLTGSLNSNRNSSTRPETSDKGVSLPARTELLDNPEMWPIFGTSLLPTPARCCILKNGIRHEDDARRFQRKTATPRQQGCRNGLTTMLFRLKRLTANTAILYDEPGRKDGPVKEHFGVFDVAPRTTRCLVFGEPILLEEDYWLRIPVRFWFYIHLRCSRPQRTSSLSTIRRYAVRDYVDTGDFAHEIPAIKQASLDLQIRTQKLLTPGNFPIKSYQWSSATFGLARNRCFQDSEYLEESQQGRVVAQQGVDLPRPEGRVPPGNEICRRRNERLAGYFKLFKLDHILPLPSCAVFLSRRPGLQGVLVKAAKIRAIPSSWSEKTNLRNNFFRLVWNNLVSLLPACRVYTPHYENTARQFRALHLVAMAHLIRVAVSPLKLLRFSPSNTNMRPALQYKCGGKRRPPRKLTPTSCSISMIPTYENPGRHHSRNRIPDVRAVSLLASRQGSGFNTRLGHSGFSHVGIVMDDAVGRWVFSRFPRTFIPVMLHAHLEHPHRLSRPRGKQFSKSKIFSPVSEENYTSVGRMAEELCLATDTVCRQTRHGSVVVIARLRRNQATPFPFPFPLRRQYSTLHYGRCWLPGSPLPSPWTVNNPTNLRRRGELFLIVPLNQLRHPLDRRTRWLPTARSVIVLQREEQGRKNVTSTAQSIPASLLPHRCTRVCRVQTEIPPQFSPCPASLQCSRVLRAPSRTVGFNRRVPHPLVHSHHEHLVHLGLEISRRHPHSARWPSPKTAGQYSCLSSTLVVFSSRGRRRGCDASQVSLLSIILRYPPGGQGSERGFLGVRRESRWVTPTEAEHAVPGARGWCELKHILTLFYIIL